MLTLCAVNALTGQPAFPIPAWCGVGKHYDGDGCAKICCVWLEGWSVDREKFHVIGCTRTLCLQTALCQTSLSSS